MDPERGRLRGRRQQQRRLRGDSATAGKIVTLSRFVALSVSLIQKVSLFQGCADEFRSLMAAHRRPNDVVILVGDVVNKGPKSAEALRLARGLCCFAV